VAARRRRPDRGLQPDRLERAEDREEEEAPLSGPEADSLAKVTPPRAPKREAPLPALFGGIGTFFRGFGVWATSPGLMALGALPALLVGIVVVAAIVLLAINLPAVSEWVTPFADRWDEVWQSAIRFAAGLAVLILAILLAVSTFTAITLAVGDPFYERIWMAVERRLGGFEEGDGPGFWVSIRRGIGTATRLLVMSAVLGVTVFLVGLIPVVGAPIAFTIGAFAGGWLVATELLGRPFDARGLTPAEQRALRRGGRGRVLGFGVAVYLVFLIPFAAVLATPAAVAGSALLARRLLEGPGSDQLQRRDGPGRRLP
jgi:CysZ protein